MLPTPTAPLLRSPSRIRARALLALGILAGLGAAGAAACGSDNGPLEDDTSGTDAGNVRRDSATAADDATVEPDAPGDAADLDAEADAGPWPTCDAKPAAVAAKTIPEIWQADPALATETWISGAYVTAISGSGCTANKACQLFVQTDLSYGSLAAAAKHSLKLFVSAATASHFTAVHVGDRVDVLAWAWRYNLDSQHELLLQVNAKTRGCAKTTSSGHAFVPLAGVTLSDLTLNAYENTHGPVLVRVANVRGKPDPSPTSTFGLFHATDGGFFDAGADAGADIVSLSPYFLPGSSFTGLAPTLTSFSSLTGIFGTFVPAGGPKYLEIYARTPSDIVVQ